MTYRDRECARVYVCVGDRKGGMGEGGGVCICMTRLCMRACVCVCVCSHARAFVRERACVFAYFAGALIKVLTSMSPQE